jgi:hypothetical protein
MTFDGKYQCIDCTHFLQTEEKWMYYTDYKYFCKGEPMTWSPLAFACKQFEVKSGELDIVG